MEITFMIGNGFDISMGLQTSYSEFYKWYAKQKDSDEEIRDFKRKINENLEEKDEEDRYWADVETGLAMSTADYNYGSNFIMCYEDIHDNLISYLKNEERIFNDEKEKILKISSIIRSQIPNYYNELSLGEKETFKNLETKNSSANSKINIICFNYTKISDLVFNEVFKSSLKNWNGSDGRNHSMVAGEGVHIHGYLDEYPILGVCKPDSIANQDLLKDPNFKAIMVKAESDKEIGEQWRRRAAGIVKRSDVICIFGMSLGETDSDYWEWLLSWIKASNERHLIIFWYEKNYYGKTSLYKKTSKTREIQDKFFDYLPIEENEKERLRSRVHVIINTQNMFKIPEEFKPMRTVVLDDLKEQYANSL